MSEAARIPTPWIHQWRRIRYQLLPVLIFAGSVALTAMLWTRHLGSPYVVGEVNVVRVDAVSPADGTLVKVSEKPPELFDTVQAGQVVARLDDRDAVTALAQMQGQLARLRVELASAAAASAEREAARRHDQQREARSLALDIENLRLSILDRRALIETDQIEMIRLTERCELLKPLVERGVESRLTLADLETQREVIRQRIEGNRKALEEAEAQKLACQQRMEQFASVPSSDIERLLAPIREAIAAEESRIQQVKRQIECADIRAPITGTITAIYAWAGQNVVAGAPILTIAATQGQYIVGYVRQEQRIRPAVGMAVDVRVRSLPRQQAVGRITQIGPQVEPVPLHQLRDPKIPEWGLPVRISIPAGLRLMPGELVDLAFKPGGYRPEQ